MFTVRFPRRHGNSRLYFALFTAALTVLAFQLLLGIDLWEDDESYSSITVTSVWVDGDNGQEAQHRQVSLPEPPVPLPDPWRPGDLEVLEWPESDEEKVVRWNKRELSEMYVCAARGACTENQHKIVMFHTHWVMGTLVGHDSGCSERSLTGTVSQVGQRRRRLVSDTSSRRGGLGVAAR
jgi:hypothetical protein